MNCAKSATRIGTLQRHLWRPSVTRTVCFPMRILRPMPRWKRRFRTTVLKSSAFSEATDLFRFRRIPGLTVTTDQFLICDDCRYDIVSVEDVKGHGMYIEVLVKRSEPTIGKS